MNTLRTLVLLSGAALLAYLLLIQTLAPFTLPVAAIVIIMGLKLAPPLRVTGGQTLGGGPLIVDRAVLGVNIYQLFFFDTRLILKRLATAKTTIFSLLLLSIIGLFVDGGFIGALAGIALGYAIQEYTTQSARVKAPVSDSTLKIGPDDVEVPYDELEKVELHGNRLLLFSKRGITRLGMSRGYASAMAPKLRTIFQKKFKETESVHSTDASSKQDN